MGHCIVWSVTHAGQRDAVNEIGRRFVPGYKPLVAVVQGRAARRSSADRHRGGPARATPLRCQSSRDAGHGAVPRFAGGTGGSELHGADYGTEQSDYQTEQSDGCPGASGDASAVGSDASAIDSDQSSMQTDIQSLQGSNGVAGIQADIAAVNSDVNTLHNLGASPAEDPSSAISTGNKAISSAKAAFEWAPQQANAIDGQAHQLATTAQHWATDHGC